MAIISNHVSASLRFRNEDDETVQFLHRIRPGITAAEVNNIRNGINFIGQEVIMSTALTVTEELVDGAS
jgi:hypothetical protein